MEKEDEVSAQMPPINSLVRVGVTDDIEVPSRIEHADGLDYAVAMPSYAGDLEQPQAGAAMRLIWTSPRGLYVAPAEYVGTDRDRVAVWVLRLSGEFETQQRREYVRVPMAGTVELTPTLGSKAAGTSAPAQLVDLSEGGLLCRMSEDAGAGRVLVRLGVYEDTYDLAGTVLRSASLASGEHDVVVTFDDDGSTGDRLRHLLVREQLRRRRAERQ
jgi:hypothetical protein